MTFPEDQILALKRYCTELGQLEEGGCTYFRLENIRLPEGCTPSSCNALLVPSARDGYPSRLFFSQIIASPSAKNWNGSTRIGEENWHAFSWKLETPNLTLEQMLIAHLRGLVK